MRTRLGVLAISVTLLIGASCHDPFTTNHNLVLIYSNDNAAAFNPVPSLDGRTIYFLMDSADAFLRNVKPDDNELHGGAWVLADSASRELLPGDFYSLALLPDGQHLLLAGRLSDSVSRLVIADTAGVVEDSFSIAHPVLRQPPQYLWLGTGVVYNAVDTGYPIATAFYAKQLTGDTSSVAILSVSWWQRRFCVFAGESIYVDSATRLAPALNPLDDDKVAYAYYLPQGTGFSALGLYDRRQRRSSTLAAPYAESYIGTPAWMPDGHDLLMAANKKEADGGGVRKPYEIWLLKSAVE
jgi:hypothetical protein